MPSSPIPDEPPSRLEVALTAFVFPGAGQLMQQRWVVAILCLTLGLALVAILLVVAILPQLQNLGIVLGMWGYTGAEPLVTPSIPAILASAGALLALHVASIIDAAVMYRKRRLRYHRAQRALHRADGKPGIPDA